MLTYTGCNVLCCRVFRRRVRCARSLSCTQLCRWSWWTHLPSKLPLLSYLDGLQPYYCNECVITLCYKSSSIVCVSITDPGMTLTHRDLTVWGRIATILLLYIHIYSQTTRSIHENTFPPPQSSVPMRSHLGAFSDILPEGDSITEGFYINPIALPMKRE